MVSRTSMLQACNVVVVLKQRVASFQHRHFLDTEVSVLLGLILVSRSTACQCASFAVLLPIDPSKNSLSNCHFVFQPSLEFSDPGI